jgi:hypothetical protein
MRFIHFLFALLTGIVTFESPDHESKLKLDLQEDIDKWETSEKPIIRKLYAAQKNIWAQFVFCLVFPFVRAFLVSMTVNATAVPNDDQQYNQYQ